ncbi:TetR/AcrR family transcriptional regulator [Sphaerisporangium fuscum]|uniref:TetR/AcrR family transcriptional regulator n=1 Tax=Sphaerisporangium fuscum TaxID=2835868 RepID=UPI002029A25F|nr:TetR/AcrR family transcriptional regulator [Sphaerisporangium fuscum]
MLDATRDLVEAGGYYGTGLNQVLAVSGAPRGSLYFHFPQGKDQLVAEAMIRGGAEVAATVEELAGSAADAAGLVTAILTTLGDRLEASGWTKGCPVATVVLEVAATNDELQKVCADIYASWRAGLAARIAADGHSGQEAEELATFVLAMIEGALLLARAERSRTPIDAVARRVTALL